MEIFGSFRINPYFCTQLDKQSAESCVKSEKLDKTQFSFGDANIVFLRGISKLFVEKRSKNMVF